MKRISKDIDNILSLKEKQRLLKEINQDDLLKLFKDKYTPMYKPIEAKKSSLDQQVNIAISQNEKDFLARELVDIRRTGPQISISSYVRNKANLEIDLGAWYQHAMRGLEQLSQQEWDPTVLDRQKKRYIRLIEELEDDKDTELYYQTKLNEITERLSQFGKIKPQRQFRLTGRVTFGEANTIRWKAARLSLSVADYLRFLLFDYHPFSNADRHLTIDNRKRFYISIIDVYKNGWGTVPVVNECSNCARLRHDIKVLREQLARYQDFIGEKQ